MTLINTERVSAEAVAWAINAANAARQAGAERVLQELPAANKTDMGQADSCVLARAFNFDCTVYPHPFGLVDRDGTELPLNHKLWVAAFSPHYASEAQALADALDTGIVHPDYQEFKDAPPKQLGLLRVVLPPEVAEIAIAFDAGELYL